MAKWWQSSGSRWKGWHLGAVTITTGSFWLNLKCHLQYLWRKYPNISEDSAPKRDCVAISVLVKHSQQEVIRNGELLFNNVKERLKSPKGDWNHYFLHLDETSLRTPQAWTNVDLSWVCPAGYWVWGNTQLFLFAQWPMGQLGQGWLNSKNSRQKVIGIYLHLYGIKNIFNGICHCDY